MTGIILCALLWLCLGMVIVSAVAVIIFADSLYDYLLVAGVLIWVVWAVWDFAIPLSVKDKVHSVWKKVVGKL